MATEQRPGRLCACGCLAPIDHLKLSAKRLPGCQWEYERVKRAAYERERAARGRRRGTGSKNVVKNLDVENRRQRPCLVCAGMPWARSPERMTEGRDGYAHRVVNDNGLCRGCGEPYAPEPPPKLGSAIRSSGGTVAAHGTLYAFDIARPGSGVKGGVLRSREKR